MKRILFFLLVMVAACKKNNDIAASNALFGSWRYTGNNKLVGENLGDTLRFVRPDTVYYTFMGSTTWSNYHAHGSQLLLIGSADTARLVIRTLNATQLRLIIDDPNLSDTAGFEKITP